MFSVCNKGRGVTLKFCKPVKKLMLGSIREFCKLNVPVIMFDKDENYVVLTLEEVCFFSLVLFCGIMILMSFLVAAHVFWAGEAASSVRCCYSVLSVFKRNKHIKRRVM